MKIGFVVTIPINKQDTTCIVIRRKTYGEIRRAFINEEKFFDKAYGDTRIYVFTFSRLYRLSDDDDASMCYELMFGDEKAWLRQYLLLRYIRNKDLIWR